MRMISKIYLGVIFFIFSLSPFAFSAPDDQQFDINAHVRRMIGLYQDGDHRDSDAFDFEQLSRDLFRRYDDAGLEVRRRMSVTGQDYFQPATSFSRRSAIQILRSV